MIGLKEWRDYAVEVLAEWISGPTEPMSDGSQYRIGLREHEDGSVIVNIVPLGNGESKLVEFRILANDCLLGNKIEDTPPVEEAVIAETPAPSESEELAQLREEVARLNRELGEAEGRHRAAMQAVQERVQTEITAYKTQLDLEHAKKKREEAKATAARSRTALVAKIAEHFAPLLAGFEYNFKDCRHVGELFDFLVFDGLEDGEIRKIVFLEVKSRKSGTRVTNPRERLLKEAVEAGRVTYEVYVPPVEVAKHEPDV